MLKILKYLKPYVPLVILAILLLFVQANCDLALPDYMSEIVNNGIQQGGIEDAIPSAIRQSEMNKVAVFLTTDEKNRVLNDYTLVDQNSSDFENLVKQYPILAKEPVYILKTITPAEKTWLNPVMGKGLLAVSSIEQLMADPQKAAAMAKQFGYDLSQLPPGMDIFALLQKMPEAQRTQMSSAIETKFASLGESAIVQSAVPVVKQEYQAIGMNTDQIQTNYILHTGGLMLLVSLVSVLCTIAVGFLSARTAAGLSRDLRRSEFRKVESFSNAEFDRFSTASLITRNTNDITQIQIFVIMMIRMVAYAPIMGVGGIIRAISKNSSMWWIIAVAVLMLISLVIIVYTVAIPKFKIIQKLIDRLNLVMRENLSGMMVIRAFNMQDFEQERFNKANQDLTGVTLFVNRVMVTMFPAMTLIMNGLSLVIIWVGAHQVAQSAMQVGDMMAFMQYAIQIVFSFLMMSMMFILLPRASVSADRIAEVLETEPSIKDPEKPLKFPTPFKGSIEFRNVCFRYPGADEDVLHDLNFIVQPGETTAIIGPTGSGKSTVVNLVPRFYDVTNGQVLIDGVDIRDVTQHDLREKIGFIPQQSVLFSGTIESNLRLANESAPEPLLLEAAEIAQASEFIESNPEKLDAEISQGGMNVSGGQKQRLSIARALVKQAPIYIFDDSFSALDFKTDAALRRAMKEKLTSSSMMIISQRVSTIKNAEQIIVLDEGKIVGKGTHQELLKTCETYREIAMSQLSVEELA